MKLHPQAPGTLRTVTGYGPGWIEINAVRYEGALIVQPEVDPQAWAVRTFESITPSDFDELARLEPDVVLLGTGMRQRFIHPKLTAALSANHVGVECMDTAAACRTYNILMTEGRRVLAALLPI